MVDTPSHLSELLSNRWALQREQKKRIDLFNWLQKDSRQFTVQRVVFNKWNDFVDWNLIETTRVFKINPKHLLLKWWMITKKKEKSIRRWWKATKNDGETQNERRREIMKNLLSACELVTFEFVCSAFFFPSNFRSTFNALCFSFYAAFNWMMNNPAITTHVPVYFSSETSRSSLWLTWQLSFAAALLKMRKKRAKTFEKLQKKCFSFLMITEFHFSIRVDSCFRQSLRYT